MILVMIISFILGFLLGLNYRTKKDTDDLIDSFAETQHLRDENMYLKKKLGFLEEQMPEDHVTLI